MCPIPPGLRRANEVAVRLRQQSPDAWPLPAAERVVAGVSDLAAVSDERSHRLKCLRGVA